MEGVVTTKDSPLSALRSQADNVADMLKRVARGEKIASDPAGKLERSRERQEVTIGIVMDDKIIQLTLPWKKIEDLTVEFLSDFIIDLMREKTGTKH